MMKCKQCGERNYIRQTEGVYNMHFVNGKLKSRDFNQMNFTVHYYCQKCDNIWSIDDKGKRVDDCDKP